MKIITNLLTWIKALSFPTKIIAGVTSIAIIGGGITASIIITQQNQNTTPNSAQLNENTTTFNQGNQQEISAQNEQKEDSPEASSSDANQATDNTSTNDNPNTSSSPANTSNQTTSQPQSNQQQSSSQTTPTKKADYNLNAPYYLSIWRHAGFYNKCWQTIGDAPKNDSEGAAWSDKFYSPECQGQGADVEIWGVGKSIVEASKAVEQKATSQYPHYYFALKAYIYEGPLTEAYCNKYGLSCDRW